jgi:4-amino-4-deoxy-L-arabinose transferase-like glycosyltransferase
MVTVARRLCKRVDFSRAITQGACVVAREERTAEGVAARAAGATRTSSSSRARLLAALLALVAGALYAIRLDVPGFFDNEGRYAEVAREMVLSGDYVTPHLDFTLFLNKPPLTFWLAAVVFNAAGPTEWARLVSLVAAVGTLFAVCRLGALLYGEAVGLVAGLTLATTLGFALEARTLRPDMIITAAVTVALLCWRRVTLGDARDVRWLTGLYAALGVGIVAKGLVPVVVAGIPIAALTLRERGWPGIRDLRPGLGVLVVGAIVLPWHVLVSLRHEGFAWDYVVNQHLLFFLDRKLPRDSEGDPLAFFWLAWAGRALPWVFLLPFTIPEAVRGFAREAPAGARATALLWAWAGGLLLFFSCAPSRLEHYSLPALPAGALLAARVWQRAEQADAGRTLWATVLGVGVFMVLVGTAGMLWGRELLSRTYWITQAPALFDLVWPAAIVAAATGAALVYTGTRRHAGALFATLALAMVPTVAIVLGAEAKAEPLFSWRPVARLVAAEVAADTEIVFESPEEYQLVGGLAYYTGRRITLLEPPNFVPPTYLARHAAGMFLRRDAFERRWRSGEPLVLVSDPLRRRDDPTALVPAPLRVLGRFGDRWVVTNVPASAGR